MMTKSKKAVGISTGILAATLMFWAGNLHGQTVRQERNDHPRLSAAITALQDARAYLEAAPHDFGGHKASAIRSIDASLVELRAALQYRAAQDRH